MIFISFSCFTCWTSGLVSSHSFAENAAVSFLIVYLADKWKKEHLPKAVAIINLQDGVTTLLAVVLAHVADSCMGRFKMVFFTTVAYISVSPWLSWPSRSNLLFSKTTPSHNLYDPYYSSWGVIINSDKIFFFSKLNIHN